MAISDDIRRGEGYELEFKRIPNEDRVKYLKTAVAFANGKGGSILFGVANDGTVHGIDKQRVFAEMDGIVDSRVEITSPGGLPRGLTVEKVLAGRSKIRNHALAEAFNYMKVIEHWRSGLRRVSKELAEYGVKPLQLEDGGIDVQINVFRNATLGDENNRYDERGARVGRQKSTLRENGVNDPINDPINLLDLIKENPSLNYGEYGKILGVSEATIKRRITELKKQWKIVRVGANKGGHWEIV